MSQKNAIPFVDLASLHVEMEEELTQVFRSALRTASFIGGPLVENFEKEFAAYCEAGHCVGVNSGTDALRFALMAAGIKAGDLVVTVPHTFIATTEAISQTGADPRFVDIDERTYNMDPERLRKYLEKECSFDKQLGMVVETRSGRPVTAVVPVHLYGQMADMDVILEIANKYNLVVIEDACQAHGAQYFSKKENRWRTAGSLGRAAAFSFYPGKNLGACGEGGAITTNDEALAKKCKMLRDHGQSRKYYHDIEGYNGRLDSIQAGLLSCKLKKLPEWTERRRAAAARYFEMFKAAGIPGAILPIESGRHKSVYHLFVIRVENREQVMRLLGEAGVGTGIHYPIPLHLQRAYSEAGYKQGDLPAAEKAAAEVLSLPMFPQLTAAQQAIVVEETARILKGEAMAESAAQSARKS